jgi:hypothetical protein
MLGWLWWRAKFDSSNLKVAIPSFIKFIIINVTLESGFKIRCVISIT